jgi:hypothetical protein
MENCCNGHQSNLLNCPPEKVYRFESCILRLCGCGVMAAALVLETSVRNDVKVRLLSSTQAYEISHVEMNWLEGPFDSLFIDTDRSA